MKNTLLRILTLLILSFLFYTCTEDENTNPEPQSYRIYSGITLDHDAKSISNGKMSKDGKTFAFLFDDTLHVYDMVSGNKKNAIVFDENIADTTISYLTIDISDDGSRLVISNSKTSTWTAYDLNSGKILATGKELLDAFLSPDGTRIATIGQGGALIIRNALDGNIVQRFNEIDGRNLNSVFTYVNDFCGSSYITVTFDSTTYLLNYNDGSIFRKIDTKGEYVELISDDASYLITYNVFGVTRGGVYETASGEKLCTLSDNYMVRYRDDIATTSKVFASGGSVAGPLGLYSLPNSMMVRELFHPFPNMGMGVYGLTFSKDEKKLAGLFASFRSVKFCLWNL